MARGRPYSGVVLPTYRSPAATDEVLDRVTVSLRGTAVAGAITARGPDVPQEQRWFIEHVTCFSDSATATTLRMFAGSIDLPNLLDGSSSGNADFGDWNPGLLVPGGSALLGYWTGASAGAMGLLNVQLTVLTRGS